MSEISLREFFAPHKHSFFINDIAITDWGKTVSIDFWLFHQTPEIGEHFILTLKKCSNIMWEPFTDELDDNQADVIAVDVFEDRTPKEIVINTILFEIIVYYSQPTVSKL
jgi:hypothetical protein